MLRRLVTVSALAITAAGCVSAGPGWVVGVPRAERVFLLPPYEGWSGSLSPETGQQLQALYLDLLEGGEVLRVLEEADALLEADPELLPAQVLAGQAAFAGGRYDDVLELLEPVLDAAPAFVAAWVLYGRVAELEGWIVEAFAAYDQVGDRSAIAAESAEALFESALTMLAERFDQQFESGDLDGASRSLETLTAWAPNDARTARAAEAMGESTGDPMERLAMLRRMSEGEEATPDLLRRRAELELQVGDPAAAVDLAERLIEDNPNDLYLGHLLTRARFQWRLNLLPAEVRGLGRSVQLSKADYAVLLYWLFPQVRYGRAVEARIATDVIDHRNQEQIIKVINMGLLEVDRTVHRFEPDAPVSRRDELGALLTLIDAEESAGSCVVAEAELSEDEARCRAAAVCGLISDVNECEPGATVSGSEALELMGRAIARLSSE